MAIADRIVLLDAGLIAQEGPPTELYSEPATLFAAEFMGSNNRLDGTLVENSGGRATIEVFGERLDRHGAHQSGCRREGDRHHPHRTRALRIEPRPQPSEDAAQGADVSRRALGAGVRDAKISRCAPMPPAPLEPGEHYVEFPPEALWVF